jgi:hypothetical protein
MIIIKNKLMKIILVTIIFIAIFNSTSSVNAETKTVINIKQPMINSNEQVTLKKIDIDTIQIGPINPDSGMDNMISKIFGVVQYICIASAVIIIIVSGVKYMAAAPNEKAEIKKQAIALVIGAIIIFSISTILRIIAAITRASI